jgi:hypothetical protein
MLLLGTEVGGSTGLLVDGAGGVAQKVGLESESWQAVR